MSGAEIRDGDEAETYFQQYAENTAGEIRRTLLRAGLLLESQIKANASGRPGPRVITGDYRGSWTTREVPGRDLVVRVGTNRPQGRRLEFGFVGADSLGRVYNQPPYPHVAPAIKTVTPKFKEMFGDAVKIHWGKD